MSRQHGLMLLLANVLLVPIVACAPAQNPADIDARQAAVSTTAPATNVAPSYVPSRTLQPTPARTRLPTAAVTPPPPPTLTHVPTPTATPMPTLQQLTRGGCCTQPFWHPDSSRVLYIDRPSEDEPLGIWAVAVNDPSDPRLYTERIALYTDDLRYLVDSDGQTTLIERLPDAITDDPGARWEVPAGGRPVSLSPGRTRVAWQVSNDALAVETRVTDIWVSNLDGSDPRTVASLPRGGLAGWISDDVLLLTGRESLSVAESVIWTYSIPSDEMVEIARGERLRGITVSPDGGWLVYYETFSNLHENGLWVVRTDGSDRSALSPELFGAYRWRDSQRLLVVPFEPDAQVHVLWQYDVEARAAHQLTEADTMPFKIANGDWRVSPDGNQIVFVASGDLNLWVLTLNGS
jgi:Tol biopolymer transport system component